MLSDASSVDPMVLVGQMYPELKSDRLYQSLMQSYSQHNSNFVSGVKDYNEMIRERRTLNHKPIVGRFIPKSDYTTITGVDLE